jgi:hypothetical protein
LARFRTRAPADIEEPTPDRLPRQQIVDLRLQLVTARSANRELMTHLNGIRHTE